MFRPCFLSNEYLVCDEGYVLSKKGKKLKPSVNKKGYQIVNLMINGKRVGISIHTLVARAFCNNYQKGLTVNHKDGNKLNNKASNLEWISLSNNIKHSIVILGNTNKRSKNPNSKRIKAIDKTTKQEYVYDCMMDAAEHINPKATYKQLRYIENSISRAANGIRKTYKGYYWQFI